MDDPVTASPAMPAPVVENPVPAPAQAPDAPSSSFVEVRNYANAAEFAADVPAWAAAGWVPVSQVEASGGRRSGWVTFGVLCIFAGFFFPPLWILALIALIVGFASRAKIIVVTYRPAALVGK